MPTTSLGEPLRWLGRAPRLRPPRLRRNEQFGEFDFEPGRDTDQRVDRHVHSPLLNPGVVGRQHPEPRGKRLLRLASSPAKLLNPEADASLSCFRAGCHHRQRTVVHFQKTESYKTSCERESPLTQSSRLFLNLITASLLLAGCRKSDPSVTVGCAVFSAHPTPSSAPARPAVPPAAEILLKRPELLTEVPREWQKRLDGALAGNESNACPAAAEARGKDEFEQHDVRASALKQCAAENGKAIELLKRCPGSLTAPVEVQPYDFPKSILSLELQRPTDMLTSSNSRIWWDRAFLLSWPGLLPQRMKPGNNLPRELRCQGGWIDNLTGMSNTNIDLSLAPDAAKAFKQTLGSDSAAVRIAFLLDGGAAEEPLDCDAMVPKTATGRVLAWRVIRTGASRVDLVPWTTVGSWEPPEDCSELARLFGVAKEAPSPTSSKDANSAATASSAANDVISAWLQAQNQGDFAAYEKLYAPDFAGVKRVGTATLHFNQTSWLNDRKGMFLNSMVVTATAVEAEDKDGGLTVRFTQHWAAGTYADEGTKELSLKKVGNQLLIAREELLNSTVVHQ